MSRKREGVLIITGAMVIPVFWAASVGLAIAAPPRTAGATVTLTGPAGNAATRQTTGVPGIYFPHGTTIL